MQGYEPPKRRTSFCLFVPFPSPTNLPALSSCQHRDSAGLPAVLSRQLASDAVLPNCQLIHFASLPAFCYNDLNPWSRQQLSTNFVLDGG